MEGYAKGLRKAWRVIGEMIEREEAARESAREIGTGEMFRMMTGKESGRASIRRGWYLTLGKTWGRGTIGRCCPLSALVLRGDALTLVRRMATQSRFRMRTGIPFSERGSMIGHRCRSNVSTLRPIGRCSRFGRLLGSASLWSAVRCLIDF